MKLGLGSVYAILGLMAVGGGPAKASADTLNGDFGFTVSYAGYTRGAATPQITFTGTGLTTATSIKIPGPLGGVSTPTSASPFVQLVTTAGGTDAMLFGFANDFLSLGGSGMDYGSLVSLASQTLSVSHINGGEQLILPPPMALLSFGGDTYNAAGTTPNQRFEFSYSEYSWSTVTSVNVFGTVQKDLVGSFTGMIDDSQALLPGGYDQTAATVLLTFHSTCPALSKCTPPTLIGELVTSLPPTHHTELPEPVSIALLGVGLVGLAVARRRHS
jgi:hypothetical protein